MTPPPELLSATPEDPWAEGPPPANGRAAPTPTPAPAPPAAAVPPREPRSAHAGAPLVAVCGLAGGAGTTLLAWLIALESLDAGDDPVLLTELPACAGGLAALTSASSAPAGLTVDAGTAAEHAPAADAEQLARALADARATQARVVVDCGRLHDAVAQRVLADASHVVWTVPAGPAAGETARALLLDSGLVPPPGGALELLAVVATRPATLSHDAARALRDVVAERAERLVLVPHVRSLARGGAGRARARPLSSAIGAIAGPLRRTPSP